VRLTNYTPQDYLESIRDTLKMAICMKALMTAMFVDMQEK